MAATARSCAGSSEMRPRVARVRLGSALGLVACVLLVPALRAEDPPAADGARVAELVREFILGSSDAAEELRGFGVAALPAAREHFDKSVAHKLEELVAAVTRAELERNLKAEPGLLYRGQFQHLAPILPEGVDTLLGIYRSEDDPHALRVRAGTALGDLPLAPADQERLRVALREITDDFLSESWFEQEAGYLLARLGDRSYIDPLIARWSELAKERATTANVGMLHIAHAELAEVYYRIGDYPSAILHYQQRTIILEGLRGGVRPEMLPALEQDLALLRYNTACSQSLAGRFEDAFASLDKGLEHMDITFDMVLQDGDLRALRATPEFAAWLEKARAARSAREPAPPAEKPDPPAMGPEAPPPEQ